MALLTNTYTVNHSLKIVLAFEDASVKTITLEVGDTVTVVYNKNGVRTTVEGVVTRIYSSTSTGTCSCTCGDVWNIALDGSKYGYESALRIGEDKILDLDMVKKANSNTAITSPTGDYNVTDFRLYGNILQLSVDNGVTWLAVATLPAVTADTNGASATLVSAVEAIIPANIRPDVASSLETSIIKLVQSETKTS